MQYMSKQAKKVWDALPEAEKQLMRDELEKLLAPATVSIETLPNGDKVRRLDPRKLDW